MDEMEEKLGAILNDPQAMQKIMGAAQAFSAMSPPGDSPAPLQEPDQKMLQNILNFSKQGSIDKNQKALLSALRPYLSQDRIHKLENAMRAAKMAGFAAVALRQRENHSQQGR